MSVYKATLDDSNGEASKILFRNAFLNDNNPGHSFLFSLTTKLRPKCNDKSKKWRKCETFSSFNAKDEDDDV